jgi:PTH1 family peptidyl-tRNA hydrolase
MVWKKKRKLSAWLGHGTWAGETLVAVKPITYVNDSGRAVRAVLDYFGSSPRELLVVVDDVNLPPGTIRIRGGGGAGGHHGLESVIRAIGTRDFARLRIGVGGGNLDNLVDHVLSRPPSSEEVYYQRAVNVAIEALAEIFNQGIERAMNCFNKKEIPNYEEAKD